MSRKARDGVVTVTVHGEHDENREGRCRGGCGGGSRSNRVVVIAIVNVDDSRGR